GKGPGASPVEAPTPPTTGSDEISEDEFEKLLDQLHGVGKAPGAVAGESPTAPAVPPPAETGTASGSADLITDAEFEDLLDQLHGRGKGPTSGGTTPQAAKSPAPAPAAADDVPEPPRVQV